MSINLTAKIIPNTFPDGLVAESIPMIKKLRIQICCSSIWKVSWSSLSSKSSFVHYCSIFPFLIKLSPLESWIKVVIYYPDALKFNFGLKTLRSHAIEVHLRSCYMSSLFPSSLLQEWSMNSFPIVNFYLFICPVRGSQKFHPIPTCSIKTIWFLGKIETFAREIKRENEN